MAGHRSFKTMADHRPKITFAGYQRAAARWLASRPADIEAATKVAAMAQAAEQFQSFAGLKLTPVEMQNVLSSLQIWPANRNGRTVLKLVKNRIGALRLF